MPVDVGPLNVNTAGAAEKFSGDLAAQAVIRAKSVVTSIRFKAPEGNSGNVFVGVIGNDGTTATVSSTYGFTLTPGDSVFIENISEKFDNFQGNAATNNDDIEWIAVFQAGVTA